MSGAETGSAAKLLTELKAAMSGLGSGNMSIAGQMGGSVVSSVNAVGSGKDACGFFLCF